MKFFQLAPTYREEARALISLMERYDWNTFSLIIDPRLPGKDELIDEFEAHGNEQRNWYFIHIVILGLLSLSRLILVRKRHAIVFISKDKRSKSNFSDEKMAHVLFFN